jgi:2-polyprenyl-3-methyl-5-hydroxy-6-metoxy-1,4-benzoquinol methylase
MKKSLHNNAHLQGSLLLSFLENIKKLYPWYSNYLVNYIPFDDLNYCTNVEILLNKFNSFLKENGKDFNYGIDCYTRKISDLLDEELNFLRTGKYRYNSFDEVKERVYNNIEIMEYHTFGLLLMEILHQNYSKKISDFKDSLTENKDRIKNYLEIAGGHGLFVWEANRILGKHINVDFIDISETSINIAKSFLKGIKVNFICQDIFRFVTEMKYDFIVAGEVLEHLEKPEELLFKIKDLLSEDGLCFISVPLNIPAIDHIYLFRNEQEIKNMIVNCKLNIKYDHIAPEYLSITKGQNNLAQSYWALLSK